MGNSNTNLTGSHGSKSLNPQASKNLADAQQRVSARAGKVAVTGRYHTLPKRVEDDYDLKKNEVLGSGYNGEVFVVQCKQDGKKYAIKQFGLHSITQEKLSELTSEAEIFLGMDHPHIARLADVYESEDSLSLVMECMEGGELFQRVVDRKKFSEKDAAEATYQMLLAVNYIHSHGVVHRDIKLENFLYESKNSDHLKLIDFGFSKIWDKNAKMDLSCGTLAYVAPEVLAKNYTSQCDLWSLGVVVFILLVGYMPFSGSEKHQTECIKSGKFTVKKPAWDKVTEVAFDFVKKLIKVDPKERLSADGALKHPWIADRATIQADIVDQGVVDALSDFAKASKFRRACMSMMAWSLTNDERKQVRDIFMQMDKNKSGTIKLWELKKVLEEKFHISDAQTREIFNAMDTNHDEEIHYSDFLAAMLSSRIAVHDDLLKKTFKRFDTDNSGYITKENLKDILGEAFTEAEAEQLLKEADANGDGQLSYQEFIAYCRGGGGTEDHAEVAVRLIDNEVKKPKQDPAVPDSRDAGPARAQRRSQMKDSEGAKSAGTGGGGGGEQKQQPNKCCTLL
eukprot:gnl/TRDRNA2_/TRDRNA2_160988_c1_seq1.p1 gnl/TRDRNA2_/TRDRNA2_160988_c1~~gnl/TRDRNA2_/TRDRNA2_160988_c1_seq1.p1  ORF type:complete len:566 (+),score=162.35 gnl/TRDRNA2_/TRDRNA2_160988_c1_seq1:76-1773(+)